MATTKSVWGIDIGQCALKALKLRSVDGQLQVEAFDVIEHPKILGRPDTDQHQLIRDALEQFLARNSVVGCEVAISVPGRSSFTRFVKLPPVETKKIPDIVRFEAEQQIPFPINEVIWRWQTFSNPDSPDIEVGLFAMKRTDVNEALGHFSSVDMDVNIVQMAPLALYNFMIYDEHVASDGATLLADVGTDKTDLVVSDGSRIWTRTIQIGGRNFTEALERAFKLSPAKAEKLKRTAATHKYARQVFQAMRPVFADLVQEIQRSIGYYSSLHREARFKSLVGLGNGFRLPGLQKFLEQNLSLSVTRIDSFNRLTPSANVNAPLFTENVLSFAVAYGLAIQGLDQSSVSTNLLPVQIAHKRRWKKKYPWFAAAAAVLLMALSTVVYRAYADNKDLSDTSQLAQIHESLKQLNDHKKQYNDYNGVVEKKLALMAEYEKLYGYRNFWPALQNVFSKAIRSVARDQSSLSPGNEAARKKIKAVPRTQRNILVFESFQAEYLTNIGGNQEAVDQATSGTRSRRTQARSTQQQPAAKRGMRIILTARTPLPQTKAMNMLITPLIREIRRLVAAGAGTLDMPFSIVGYAHPTFSTSAAGSGPRRDSTGSGRITRSQYGPSARGVVPARGRDDMRGMDMRGGPGDMRMGRPSPVGRTGTGLTRRPGMERPGASRRGTTTATEEGPQIPDPQFPDEDMINDTRFQIVWIFAIDSNGVTKEKTETKSSSTRRR